jgi:hypothetical protein
VEGLHTAEVGGSSPSAPTTSGPGQGRFCSFWEARSPTDVRAMSAKCPRELRAELRDGALDVLAAGARHKSL